MSLCLNMLGIAIEQPVQLLVSVIFDVFVELPILVNLQEPHQVVPEHGIQLFKSELLLFFKKCHPLEEIQVVGEFIEFGSLRQAELVWIGIATPQQLQRLIEFIEIDHLADRFVAIAVVETVIQLLEPFHLLQTDLTAITLPGQKRHAGHDQRSKPGKKLPQWSQISDVHSLPYNPSAAIWKGKSIVEIVKALTA